MYCVSLLYFIIVRLHKLKTLRLLAQRSYYFAVHTHKIPIFARSSDVHYLIITNFSLQKSLILALAKLCLQQLWLNFRSRLLPSSIPFSLASSNFIFRLPQVFYAHDAVLHMGRLDILEWRTTAHICGIEIACLLSFCKTWFFTKRYCEIHSVFALETSPRICSSPSIFSLSWALEWLYYPRKLPLLSCISPTNVAIGMRLSPLM